MAQMVGAHLDFEVEQIHQNVDKAVSLDALAEMVHMGRPSFYENFGAVVHMSPLQLEISR